MCHYLPATLKGMLIVIACTLHFNLVHFCFVRVNNVGLVTRVHMTLFYSTIENDVIMHFCLNTMQSLG